ncbi:MAG: molybdenum cofactor guanylyltransferase MobA [Steroidobacteraceae bacterium]
MIEKSNITGLILAGGRGTRMGGVDKGLQPFQGAPLARHAITRLAPQVGVVIINANRNQEVYRAMGAAVYGDEVPDFAGPLAGMLAGLNHCTTPYLVTVPCDTPYFPHDLVACLSSGLTESDIVTAYTREADQLSPQPVFCLMKTALRESLRAFIDSGQRKTGLWARELNGARVIFDDAAAFANFNTLGELTEAERPHP